MRVPRYSHNAVNMPLQRGFLLSVAALAAALLVTGSAAAATPRVLVAEFHADVNPVTRDFLVSAIHRGERDGDAAETHVRTLLRAQRKALLSRPQNA